jgi:hypothetical protein
MLGPLFVLATAAILAQDPQGPPPPGPPPPQGEALRVFLDCQYECDLDYLRTEIMFVNWVRDRYDGQVLILVTSQTTGGRGTDYTLTFIGQRDLAGRTDTLHYITQPGATGDETRRGMARLLRLGLVRFSMATPLAAHLDVRFAPPGGPGGPNGPGGAARERRDPWHRWVYSASLNSYLNGQESYSDRQFSGNLSASRITEAWKIELSLYGSDYRSRYTYQVSMDSTYQLAPGVDTTVSFLVDTTTRATRQSWSGSARVVGSLGAHWSAGLQAAVSGSTSANTDLKASVMPAIEYDLFPYAQSTRRQLRFNYQVGIETAQYHDTTVYFKTAETYFKHELDVALGLRQPWGSASLSLSGTQFWNDARNPNLDLYGSLSVRVIRGLSANAWGGYSFVRSQRYLRAEVATPQDVLLQLQQLRTSYQYWGGFGFSYTFGSVYNNVVNPRFGSSGGGGMTIIMN